MTCPKCGFSGEEIVENRPFVDSVMKVELRHVQDSHVGEKVWGKEQKDLDETDKLPKKFSEEYESTSTFLEEFKDSLSKTEVFD